MRAGRKASLLGIVGVGVVWFTCAALGQEPSVKVTDCDYLAASQLDETRPKTLAGIPYERIDTSRAIPACRKALEQYPTDVRLKYQLARALRSEGKHIEEARRLLDEASDADFPPAVFELGYALLFGRGLPKDQVAAVAFLTRAIKLGFKDATVALAYALETGQGIAKDEAAAIDLYWKSLEPNQIFSMRHLGLMIGAGRGLPMNKGDANEWFRRAAALGDSFSLVYLGLNVQEGLGAVKDEHEAAQLFRKAAEAGDLGGMLAFADALAIGRGVERDSDEAFRWYNKVSEHGDPHAIFQLQEMIAAGFPAGMRFLAACHRHGIGVARDEGEALSWYRKAAQADDVESMYQVGILLKSNNAQENTWESVVWLMKAASLGHTYAMIALAEQYRSGSSFARDYETAQSWLRRSADGGNALAMWELGKLYRETAMANPIRAVHWFEKAGGAGNADAALELGKMLFRGDGVTQDNAKGALWLKRAAELGSDSGMFQYAGLLRRGIGVRKDREEARRWFSKAAERVHGSAIRSLREMAEEDQPVQVGLGLGPYSPERCEVIATVASAMAKAGMLEKASALGVFLAGFHGEDKRRCGHADQIVLDSAESATLQWLRVAVLATAECSAAPRPKICEEGGSAHAVLLPLALLGK